MHNLTEGWECAELLFRYQVLCSHHLQSECKILSKIEFPFCMKRYAQMQDGDTTAILTEARLGGELFKVLHSEPYFSQQKRVIHPIERNFD